MQDPRAGSGRSRIWLWTHSPGIPPRWSWCLTLLPAWIYTQLWLSGSGLSFLSSKLGVWGGESAPSLCHLVPSKSTQPL